MRHLGAWIPEVMPGGKPNAGAGERAAMLASGVFRLTGKPGDRVTGLETGEFPKGKTRACPSLREPRKVNPVFRSTGLPESRRRPGAPCPPASPRQGAAPASRRTAFRWGEVSPPSRVPTLARESEPPRLRQAFPVDRQIGRPGDRVGIAGFPKEKPTLAFPFGNPIHPNPTAFDGNRNARGHPARKNPPPGRRSGKASFLKNERARQDAAPPEAPPPGRRPGKASACIPVGRGVPTEPRPNAGAGGRAATLASGVSGNTGNTGNTGWKRAGSPKGKPTRVSPFGNPVKRSRRGGGCRG